MRVLVLGAAVSGRAAARLALKLGHDVTIYDRSPSAVADVDDPATTAAGEWHDGLLDGYDLVVTSPGIPEQAAPIQAALAGDAPLVSELEFAAAQLDAPYVAITGTNGKTTVTETTAAMLRAGGMRAVAAGNVGLALSDIALDPWDCVAVEASSFQLRFIDRFHPKAAAVLNIAPDHLDWHPSFEAYVAAKARITENQTSDDLVAYDASDGVAEKAVARSAAQRVPVSGTHRPAGGNGPEGDELSIGPLRFPRPDLDAVWQFDVAIAATLAEAVGCPAAGIEAALASFRPATHRRTVVAAAGGITWVNDSKATNPHAAVAAAAAYTSVILIAGGRNKGLDLAPLTSVPSVRVILALGEAAPELAAAGGEKVTIVPSLAEAVTVAGRLALPGDTVLLAPGCASFDMFDSYAQRGDIFTELVRGETGGPRGA